MKKLIFLIFLSVVSSSVFSASDAYKCNINATYKLGADGMLFIDKDNPYGAGNLQAGEGYTPTVDRTNA